MKCRSAIRGGYSIFSTSIPRYHFFELSYKWSNAWNKCRVYTFVKILFFITYIYKELQFSLGGTPLLFSLDEIRTTRDLNGESLIKGSSDTISTIGSVTLIFYLTNKLKYRYLCVFIMTWILIRYGVRTPVFSIIIAYLVWNYGKVIFTSRYYILFIVGSLFVFLSSINIQDYFK